MTEIKILAEKFKNFSINECRESSELYEFLSMKISEDEELLHLAANGREGQPIPNLFLGAVHYLLLKGNAHPLKTFYPSIVENPKPKVHSIPIFKDFCFQFEDDIITILKTKLVQTNEVRRCSYLYPTFSYIYDIVKKPLALIEIGTSAGLQLYWDKYSYSYVGDEGIYGNKDSGVKITSEIKGDRIPMLPKGIIPVAKRIGLDLHINDLSIHENYLWLNALVWPEHNERRVLFEKAANYVRDNNPTLIEGDGVETLPELASQISKDYAICVFHTHVANQMPRETKVKLLEEVKNIGIEKDIFHIYNNIQDRDLHLDYYVDGNERCEVVCSMDGHGRWFSWKL